MSYEFCYYNFFLLTFKERSVHCVSKKTERCLICLEVNFNNYIDIKIFELFLLTDEILLTIDFNLKN